MINLGLELALAFGAVLFTLHHNIKLAGKLKELEKNLHFNEKSTNKQFVRMYEHMSYFNQCIGEQVGIVDLLVKKEILTEEELRGIMEVFHMIKNNDKGKAFEEIWGKK